MSTFSRTTKKFTTRRERNDSRYFETKGEAVERLKQKKERTGKIKELKEEIHFKTGNEYFFKMNSLKQQNNELVRLGKFDIVKSKQKVVQLNFEIIKIEKKLKKTLPIFNPVKFLFKNGEISKRVESKQELKPDKEKLKILKEYLESLYRTKGLIEEKIQNTKNQKKNRR